MRFSLWCIRQKKHYEVKKEVLRIRAVLINKQLFMVQDTNSQKKAKI